jgi:hypothetical protein
VGNDGSIQYMFLAVVDYRLSSVYELMYVYLLIGAEKRKRISRRTSNNVVT